MRNNEHMQSKKEINPMTKAGLVMGVVAVGAHVGGLGGMEAPSWVKDKLEDKPAANEINMANLPDYGLGTEFTIIDDMRDGLESISEQDSPPIEPIDSSSVENINELSDFMRDNGFDSNIIEPVEGTDYVDTNGN